LKLVVMEEGSKKNGKGGKGGMEERVEKYENR
jgi:hypothetical protein